MPLLRSLPPGYDGFYKYDAPPGLLRESIAIGGTQMAATGTVALPFLSDVRAFSHKSIGMGFNRRENFLEDARCGQLASPGHRMHAIEVQGLSKTFRTYKKPPGFIGALKSLVHRKHELVEAVKNVSFAVQEGELVGFLGPNGAGKTTTLKMLSGLLYPSSGSARVLGYVPWERDDGYRRQFALLLGQKNQLWWDLPAYESLALNAKIYGIEKSSWSRTVDELSEMLNARDKLNTMVRELSLGERMKMELIASLLHKPRVLFLDEPTIGLDVVSQQIVREFLRAHNATQKTTILLTSHYMADIQALCRRVIIIDHGSLFFDGKLEEVLDRFADVKIVTIQCGEGGSIPADLDRYGAVVERNSGMVKLKVKRERVIAVCKALLDELPVTDIDIQEVPIEEVIRQLFAREQPGTQK